MGCCCVNEENCLHQLAIGGQNKEFKHFSVSVRAFQCADSGIDNPDDQKRISALTERDSEGWQLA